MRLQIGGVISQQRVSGGMGFVKSIARKLCHQIKNFLNFLGRIAALYRAFDEALALLRHFLSFLFPHGAPEQVGFAK